MILSLRRAWMLLSCGLVLTLVTACSGGSASLSPIGPSPSPSPLGSGATISGQVTGLSTAQLSGQMAGLSALPLSSLESGAATQATDGKGVTVSIVGTSKSTTADANGQFTLTDVPSGDVQLTFSATGVTATITITGVGPNDRVQISVRLSGVGAKVESESHSSPDNNKREYQGRITAINAAARTFVVSGLTVNVPASAVIRHGSRTILFTELAVRDHVQVRGVKDGTTITATEVKVERDQDDGDNESNQDDGKKDSDVRPATVELEGVVSGLTGACPQVSFTVQGTKATTSAATVYEGVTCATLKNLLRVEVKGTKAADGSVVATKISLEEVELSGPISGLVLSGTNVVCPATFTVQNIKVTTTATTVYQGVTCATLKNTLKVEVKGTSAPAADGSIVATKVALDD